MAIDFTQRYGFGHVCLTQAYGSVAQVPWTWSIWIKVDSTWTGADKYLITLLAASNGDGFRLQLSGSSSSLNPPPPGATFVVEAVVDDFVFTEGIASAAVPFLTWLNVVGRFDGSGSTCNDIALFVNGVKTSFVPTMHPNDVLVHTGIGGYRPGATTTQAINDTCTALFGRWDVALSDADCEALSNVVPNTVQFGDMLDYLVMAVAASAGDNSIGSDYTVNEVPPSGLITTCPSSPIFNTGQRRWFLAEPGPIRRLI